MGGGRSMLPQLIPAELNSYPCSKEFSFVGNLGSRRSLLLFADTGRGLGKTGIDSQTTLQY